MEGLRKFFSGNKSGERRQSDRKEALSAKDYIAAINTFIGERSAGDGHFGGQFEYNGAWPEWGSDTLLLPDGSAVTITMTPTFGGGKGRTNPRISVSLIMSGPVEREFYGQNLRATCEVMTRKEGIRSRNEQLFIQSNNVRQTSLNLSRGKAERRVQQQYYDVSGNALIPESQVISSIRCISFSGITEDTDFIVVLKSVEMA